MSTFVCSLTWCIIFRISIRARYFWSSLNCLKDGSRDNRKHLSSSTLESDHSLSLRCLSLYSFDCFLYKGGLLSTSSINFSTFSTTDLMGKFTALQLACNYFVASARGQAWTCAFHLYQQQFCCLENRSGCNLLVAATEKLKVRALSYKAMLSIPGQLKLQVRAYPNI